MPRAFAAEQPTVLLQRFEHIAVADLGALESHAAPAQGQLDRHIGHQGTDYASHGFVARQTVVGHQVEQFVAIELPARRVHHQHAISVTVERDAKVRTLRQHRCHQGLWVRGAGFVVDVHSIRRAADGDHIGAQFVKHLGRNLVGRAMGCIDHDAQALEREVVGEHTFAKFDVTPWRIVQATRPTKVARTGPSRRLGQRSFHLQLPGVIQLVAIATEELDAVVCKRVVAGADDHAQAGPLRSGEVGHGGRGNGPEQHHINAGRTETRL